MANQGIPLIGPLLNKIIGTRNDRFVKRYNQRAAAIDAREAETRKLTDAQLRSKVVEFRDRVSKGTKPDDLMAEAFAVAREAMDRAVGIRNIFNPRHNFDPNLLPEALRGVYARIRAEMDAAPPLEPTGEWMGFTHPIPGWMYIDIPNEIYEAVKEIYKESRPPFRARPFDVQLIGGMVLCQGKIAEMKTGEGKTIVGPLACYMAAIERMKVHVVTVNDYLVQRDRDWTAPYFHALGLTVGAIHPNHMQDEDQKRVMYACDVVYGTTAEFGFDYLRDNMKRSAEQQVQRRRQFAIVDEVDSILIDEARTPLIISGQAHEDTPRYDLADRLARHLVEKQRPWTAANEQAERCKMRLKGLEGDIRQARDKSKVPELNAELQKVKAELPQLEAARDRNTQYFEVKLERKQAYLTHEGVSEAQRVAGIGSFYVDENIDMPHLLEQSLRAHAVYERDKDYIITTAPDPMTGRPTPTVVIVDVNTGRPMVGRQWSDGLHQAVECKERVPIKQETQTVATITIQNFFKMYKRLAGMTGTADTEAQEFHDIYHLDVVAIPTNRNVVRRDFEDMVFLTAKDKWNAVVDEIKAFHDVGRPILVGTTSVEKSEMLAKLLTQRHGIAAEVLNAKQHEREAHIVENAGQLGAVMIATNMAGRGTDIKLGPVSREALLDHWLRRGIAPRTVTTQSTEEELREGTYRKIASKELGLQKKDVETMPFPELELQLLRHWADKNTWLTNKQIESMNPDQLRLALDEAGRFLLHRLSWFETTEKLGGLHVIGTERHEARRIDNQLRGRSGRQGDKGSSRFFISLEDDLMKMFAGDTTMKVLARMGMKEGDAIEHPMLSKSVERAQRKVEERNFQVRKQVLEYDEVMEHQRQGFYGLRQRALEGRQVRGLIFEFIGVTVADAAEQFLDPEYPATCAAEFAKAKLDCSITPDRLRGREVNEMERIIIDEAIHEARQTISMTLGEYMPVEGSEVAMDFDSAGLIGWARSRFAVELAAADLREGGLEERRRVLEVLTEAAIARIEATDLSGLVQFVEPNYGARELVDWVREKLSLTVTVEEILAAQKAAEGRIAGVATMLLDKVQAAYRKREVEYPVDFTMQLTMILMKQSRDEGMNHLVTWANSRFKMGWDAEIIKKRNPVEVRKELLDESEKFFAEGRLDKEVQEALACKTDAELEKHLMDRFDRPLPDTMRYLEGKEREEAVQARIENILRTELLHFERTLMLDTLDSAWKDHLYAMDQLRDSINFRAFSQQDPRIEYKREGSHMFSGMMDLVRSRITEYVFKAKLAPPMASSAAPRPAALRSPQAVGSPRPGVTMPGMMSGIVGPGFGAAQPPAQGGPANA